MSSYVKCDGCGVELTSKVHGRAALAVTRVNGLQGAAMPDPDHPWDLCEKCGNLVGELVLLISRHGIDQVKDWFQRVIKT